MTTSRSTRAPSTPIPTAPGRWPGVRPAQGRPLSVRRDRRARDLVGRLFDALRRHRRHPPDARPAVHRCPPISPAWAATSNISARTLNATKYKSFGAVGRLAPRRGRLHQAAAGCAAPVRRPGPPDRPLLRAAAARLRHSRHRPAGPARPLQRRRNAQHATRRGSPTRSAARPITRRRLEVEIPISASLRNLGLRPSAYVDAGSLWSITKPELTDILNICALKSGQYAACVHILQAPGRSGLRPGQVQYHAPASRSCSWATAPKPRLSIGIGVNWVSPFGPLRIDLAKALLKQEGDDTKLFSFNVGTQF